MTLEYGDHVRYACEQYADGMQRIETDCVFDVVDRDGEQRVILLRSDEIEVEADDALIHYNHDFPRLEDVELIKEVINR